MKSPRAFTFGAGRLVLLALAALSLVLTSVAPASAGGIDGGGSGSRSIPPADSGGGSGGGSVRCRVGSYNTAFGPVSYREGYDSRDASRNVFDEYYGWDHLNGNPRACGEYQWSSEKLNCDIGFEVWRFYGTQSGSKTRAWTVSRAFLPNLCTNQNSLFIAPHPHDAAVALLTRAQHPQSAGGTTVTQAEQDAFWAHVGPRPWLGSTVDVRGSLQDAASVYGDGRYGTSLPFRWSGACYSLQPSFNQSQYNANNWTSLWKTALDPFFTAGSADYNSEEGAAVRSYVRSTYNRLLKSWPAAVARSFVNFPYNQNPTSSAGKYNDGLACSSDLDFWKKSASSGAASDPNKVVYSVCYVPITRVTNRMNYPTNQAPTNSFRSPTAWYQERYAKPRKALPNLPWEADLKKVIRDEIASRQAANIIAPRHSQYAASWHPSSPDGSNAADYASKNAECAYGTGSIAYKAPPPPPMPPTIDMSAQVVGDEVGQVGGAIRQMRIDVEGYSTVAGDIPCKASPCVTGDPRPGGTGSITRFQNDETDLTLVPPAGYKECKTAGERNCDFRIVTRYKDTKDANGSGHMVVEFYRATPPNKPYQLTATGGIRYEIEQFWRNCLVYEGSDTVAGGGSGSTSESSCTDEYKTLSRVSPVSLDVEPSDKIPVVGSAITPG